MDEGLYIDIIFARFGINIARDYRDEYYKFKEEIKNKGTNKRDKELAESFNKMWETRQEILVAKNMERFDNELLSEKDMLKWFTENKKI